ncbi:MAG: glycosyltransferase [Candidatus Omnitrophica bacterium]|nr:glycosyltransferase [Candidatus Omnitrophota bacterium]
MRVALIFNWDRADTVGLYFQRALAGTGHTVDHYWTKAAAAIPRTYDLYLRVDHGDYTDDLPADLQPCVFVVVDTHLPKPYKKIRRQVTHYDLVCCAQQEGALRLQRDTGTPCCWLPLGCDPEIHRRLEVPKQYDIGFVGTDGKKSLRKQLLAQLTQRYPRSRIGTAPHTEMASIYSAARIAFNYSLRNDINMRMFEVLSCGALLVTNAIHDNGFGQLFRDREHLVSYQSPDELWRLIDYYLAHEAEREAIAARGRHLATAAHTYRHRVGVLLELVGRLLGGRYPSLAMLKESTCASS